MLIALGTKKFMRLMFPKSQELTHIALVQCNLRVFKDTIPKMYKNKTKLGKILSEQKHCLLECVALAQNA